MTITERFGANLKAARKRAGISQEEASYRAGLYRTEFGLLELGQRAPRLATLLKVAGAVGVEPGVLLEGLRWRPADYSPGSFDGDEEKS